ncbi:MAG: Dihydrolipoyllysine-residue acetyltransferase component of pyruvate dehydrogenase complex [Microbacteriaceae bacterium]|nr:Dihydrolipoyllysine-residue acetyltransferase component of pyruvate dehydrogenase complex [Microbacteriaceae bacterium]
MMTDFALPDLGEGLTEAELVHWMVAPGDTVTLNQVICEVETAKALVELPSPIAGTVGRLCVEEGDTVTVGTPIITFGAASVAEPVEAEPVEAPESDEGRSNVLVGYGPGEHDARSGRKRRSHSSRASTGSATVSAKPPVRRLAKDRGIDIASLVGTGPDGHVTRGDVVGAASTSSATVSSATVGADETRVPIAGVRKRTAEAMVRSAFTAPHVTEFVTVDVTATVELVAKLREHPSFAGVRVTPLLLVAKALLFGLARHPELGSKWDEAAQEIVTTRAVNLGIAVATPRGLMVPNVKDAASLSLARLAAELTGLADRAREGKTALAEFSGGTISITNIGGFGIDSGTPIINPGEAAILCVGAIRRQPWEYRDEIALRSVMTLSVSFDHRLVDGFEGSGFLRDIASVLRDPTELIALG